LLVAKLSGGETAKRSWK